MNVSHVDPNEKGTVKKWPDLPAASSQRQLFAEKDYTYVNEDAVSDEVRCPICLEAWTEPVEASPCGHVFCRACLVPLVEGQRRKKGEREGEHLTCANCRDPIEEFRAPHRSLVGIVNGLVVRCKHCGWQGRRDALPGHSCTPSKGVEDARVAGNDLFKKGDFDGAIEEYSRGIEMGRVLKGKAKAAAELHKIYSNRAMLFTKKSMWTEAHADAEQVISLKSDFSKGYLRRAFAAWGLKKHPDTIRKDLQKCLKLERIEDAEVALQLLDRDASMKIEKVLETIAATPSEPSPQPSPQADTKKKSAPLPPQAQTQPTKKAADEKPTTNSAAPPNKTEMVARHHFALLRLYWAKMKALFPAQYKDLNVSERKTLLKHTNPFLAPRKGDTLDEEGEDVSETTYLCPELNLFDLTKGSGDGLLVLYRLVEDMEFPEFVHEAVKEVADCFEGKEGHHAVAQRRFTFLSSLTEKKKGNRLDVVDAVTGEIIAEERFKVGPGTDPRYIQSLQDKRHNREWVAVTWREVAIDRVVTLLKNLLTYLNDHIALHNANDSDLAELPSISNAYGCCNCGVRSPAPSVVCDCGLVHYCSEECKKLFCDKDTGHGHSLFCVSNRLDTGNVGDAWRARSHGGQVPADLQKTMEKLGFDKDMFSHPGTREADLEAIRYTTDVERCKNDPYGDGDQTLLVSRTDKTMIHKMQKLRVAWADGMGFCPLMRDGQTNELTYNAYIGSVEGVKSVVEQLAPVADTQERKNVVNKRDHLMRFNGLLSAICGARAVGMQPFPGTPNHLGVVEYLISQGSDVNAKDILGMSCIHHCCSGMGNACSTALIKPLALAGAKLNVENRCGDFPISEAIQANKLDIVKEMLLFGADPNMTSSSGVTPMQFVSFMSPTCKAALNLWGSNFGLKIGSAVELKGIVSKSHLNGKRGTVQDLGNARVVVKLPDSETAFSFGMDKVVLVKSGATSSNQKRRWVLKNDKNAAYSCMLDPSGRNSSTHEASKLTFPKGEFVVKLQVPMNPTTKAPVSDGGMIAAYDRRRSFQVMASPSSSQDYHAVFNAVATDRRYGGCKAYMKAHGEGDKLIIHEGSNCAESW